MEKFEIWIEGNRVKTKYLGKIHDEGSIEEYFNWKSSRYGKPINCPYCGFMMKFKTFYGYEVHSSDWYWLCPRCDLMLGNINDVEEKGYEQFSGDGKKVEFILEREPAEILKVIVNGKERSYSVEGNKIKFKKPPSSGHGNVQVIYKYNILNDAGKKYKEYIENKVMELKKSLFYYENILKLGGEKCVELQDMYP